MSEQMGTYLSLYPWMPPIPMRLGKHWREITHEVAERHETTLEALVDYGQRIKLGPARAEAWALIYDQGRLSYPAIGERFGGRDHTTIMVGVRNHRLRAAGELVPPRLRTGTGHARRFSDEQYRAIYLSEETVMRTAGTFGVTHSHVRRIWARGVRSAERALADLPRRIKRDEFR